MDLVRPGRYRAFSERGDDSGFLERAPILVLDSGRRGFCTSRCFIETADGEIHTRATPTSDGNGGYWLFTDEAVIHLVSMHVARSGIHQAVPAGRIWAKLSVQISLGNGEAISRGTTVSGASLDELVENLRLVVPAMQERARELATQKQPLRIKVKRQ